MPFLEPLGSPYLSQLCRDAQLLRASHIACDAWFKGAS
jgi:hypothetical protein